MKKHYLIVIFIQCWILFTLPLQAQNDLRRRIDSLEQLLPKKTTDTGKAWVMGLLSQAYSGQDSTKAFRYAQQCLAINKKQNYRHGIAFGYYSMGFCYLDVSNFDAAKRNFQLADSLTRNDTSKLGLFIHIRAVGNIANVMAILRLPKTELELLIGLIPDIERTKDSNALGVVVANIASELNNVNEQRKAYPYFLRAIEIFKRSPLKESLALVYLNMTECMEALDSIPQMKHYLDEAKKVLQAMTVSDMWPNYYVHEGQYLRITGQQQAALNAFRKGEEIAVKYRRDYPLNNIWKGMGETYVTLKDYTNARKYIRLFYDKAVNEKAAINQLEALQLLAAIEDSSGNRPQAYAWLKKYNQLNDSIKQEEVKVQVADLEARYQNAKHEQQILRLQNKTKQQELVLQRSAFVNYLLIAGFVILLILLLLLYILHRNRKRVYAFEMEKVRQEHRISLLYAMLEGQEQERTRLARDLHDGLGGILSGTKMELSTVLKEEQQPSSQNALQKCLQWLNYASDELRRIAWSLMPETLVKFGLGAASTAYCDGLRSTGYNIVCQVLEYSNKMETTRQVVLYRVMQELVNNAIKHAEASEILVQLQEIENHITLTVEDNGKGIPAEKQQQSTSSGMTNIRARVEFLHGTLDIDTSPGVGTTFTIACPVIP